MAGNYNKLGKTDLFVSEVGFGGYRIDIKSPLNREALKKALISGINLIDTGATYTDGNSELLIGEVLVELINSNRLSRESVVIVTKGEYSEDQITQSLERLQIETIDVYLLNNPEKKAFEYLEKEVKKGRIKYYGISLNDFTCIEEVIKIAEELPPDNHFAVIEFPMNFAETGAFANKLLEFAQEKNLGVLISRPLNANYNNKLINLAEPIIHNPPTPQQISDELEVIRQLELAIAGKFEETLFVADELKNNWLSYEDISQWQAALNQHFLPRLRQCNKLIKSSSFADEELEISLHSCTYKIARLFNQITAYYKNEHLKYTATIKANLIKSVPELSSAKNLSNMAIRALRSTKGVTSVLVGMTQTPYVQDVLDELKTPVNKDFDWYNKNLKIF